MEIVPSTKIIFKSGDTCNLTFLYSVVKFEFFICFSTKRSAIVHSDVLFKLNPEEGLKRM